MIKRFLKNISQSFAIYLLAALNLTHAIQHNSYDWLLWTSFALVGVSLILALVFTIRGGDADD